MELPAQDQRHEQGTGRIRKLMVIGDGDLHILYFSIEHLLNFNSENKK